VLAAAVPWLVPLAFASRPPGWHTGRSGTVSVHSGIHAPTPMSTAWAANVRYRDTATADPPNRTLTRMPRRGIVIWASIAPPDYWRPTGRRVSTRRTLAHAYRFACCEAAWIAGGEWEIYLFGPRRAYSVIVRVYWGSPPTRTMRAGAEGMLRRLHLPPAR
jgi:hypothetical protein